eukprot:1384785-Prymnesium_polylepis.1
MARFSLGSFGSPSLTGGLGVFPSPRTTTRSSRITVEMGRRTRSTDTMENSAIRHRWDTTPLMMRAWLDALPEYLEEIDSNYVSWWAQRYTLDRNGTVCGPSASSAPPLNARATPWPGFHSHTPRATSRRPVHVTHTRKTAKEVPRRLDTQANDSHRHIARSQDKNTRNAKAHTKTDACPRATSRRP